MGSFTRTLSRRLRARRRGYDVINVIVALNFTEMAVCAE